MYGKFVISLAIFGILEVSSQETTLECYDCDPKNELEKCADPRELSPIVSNCNKILKVEPNSTLICLSAYIKNSEQNQTGFYRGCRTQKYDVANYCDYFKEEFSTPNLTIINCASCNTDRCNIQKFTADEKTSAGNINTARYLSALLGIIIMNILYK
ncbi:uncharacterized protein LOC143206602 [Rhynchophorus ferrugineus]|uniref:Protein sleepless n=1 Tax=Rhynchophorus ferrugineus TaxID=354439 RepID=A0A834M1V1_RHYFE|nr:hypothetical protein GWI33_023156 [Rhynchophorus ferrugineus]